MKILEYEQGTPEWFEDRMGIPTASEFDKIITGTGKPAVSARTYMHRLLAEWMVGKPVEGLDPTFWMMRGKELESEALDYYQFQREVEITRVGFVVRDDRLAGCSPDGLIADDGMVEVKSPAPGTQVEYLLAGKTPTKYIPQTQGQLYIAERDWVDFVSYHPELPPVIIRAHRDDAFIKKLEAELDKFIERMLAKREQLREAA